MIRLPIVTVVAAAAGLLGGIAASHWRHLPSAEAGSRRPGIGLSSDPEPTGWGSAAPGGAKQESAAPVQPDAILGGGLSGLMQHLADAETSAEVESIADALQAAILQSDRDWDDGWRRGQ